MARDWSPRDYLKFEDERTRPALDLLNAVPGPSPRRIVDIGCGPGNSTELLVQRFPEAAIHGLDASPNMVEAARARLPQVTFELGDIRTWEPRPRFELIFANAVLQWLPDHTTLLPRLASFLAPGGSLAIQMPDNLDEPSHALMRDVAEAEPWRDLLAGARTARARIARPQDLYAQLLPSCSRIDIWRTIYYHPLNGADAIVDWLSSTGLRPFLEPLADDMRHDFLNRYRARLQRAYEPLPDGMVLLAFPRLFIVATRTRQGS